MTLIARTMEFVSEIEDILLEHVKNNYPVDWDENFITRSLLKEIRHRLGSVFVADLQHRTRIDWVPYKLSGTPENKFGDIAILVNIRYQDGDGIEGVAFLEAKKRNQKETEFGAIKTEQLENILKNAPSSMMLLYDYDDITQFVDFIPSKGPWLRGWKYKPCTCAVTVPLTLVSNTRKRDMTLYKFSLPFSYQLVFRYFQGLDLEFQKNPIQIAKGYASDKGLPTYLVAVSVAYGKVKPEVIEFNKELFTEIGEDYG